jgi:hypothetical protein
VASGRGLAARAAQSAAAEGQSSYAPGEAVCSYSDSEALGGRNLGTPKVKHVKSEVMSSGGGDMPQQWENAMWERVKEFESQNPRIVEAMRVLNMTREEYFRLLAAMTQQPSNVSNTSA